MAIVSGLRCVDRVVQQNTDDKFEAWRQLGFDKIFVGDDWLGHPRWVQLQRRFSEVGVEIVYFPYTESTSSTRIRQLIENGTAGMAE